MLHQVSIGSPKRDEHFVEQAMALRAAACLANKANRVQRHHFTGRKAPLA
jgi:hypothetical protein